jgi:syntaxin 16
MLFLVEKLSKLHTKRLMVRFDGSESQHEQEIEHITVQITDEFRKAERVLQRMAADQHGISQADAKTRQNVQRWESEKKCLFHSVV